MTEPPKDAERPTAFVSYAQSGDSWQKTVLQFTTALRRVGGVEAELDLFHSADHRQWTTFGPSLIDKSDFTLIAVDSAYKRRWEGAETEGVGAGAAREAAAIKAIFERSQDEALRRVKVILSRTRFDGDPETRIPTWKKGTPKPCHDRRNTPMSCSIAALGWSPTPAVRSPT